MKTVLLAFILWLLLSFLMAVLTGKFINKSRGKHDPR